MPDLAMFEDSIIAVGDIHGCDSALSTLLTILLPLPNRVVFLGDYVDRGPSSPKVLGLLIWAKMQRPDWIFLLGNHELMLLQNIDLLRPPFASESAFEQYSKLDGVPQAHKDFLNELDFFWESERFIFIHGGIEGRIEAAVEDHEIDELVWTYKINKDWAGKCIVRGHLVIEEPEQFDTHIGLDTGCVFGGFLSAGILDDSSGQLLEAIQVNKDGSEVSIWIEPYDKFFGR